MPRIEVPMIDIPHTDKEATIYFSTLGVPVNENQELDLVNYDYRWCEDEAHGTFILEWSYTEKLQLVENEMPSVKIGQVKQIGN